MKLLKSVPLNTMTKDIINTKELQCESSSGKQKKFQHALTEGKVNQRASQCATYLKSLYDVIYPKGINARKK